MKKFVSVLLSLLIAFSLSVNSFALCAVTEKTESEKPFENSDFFNDGDYVLHYRTYEPKTAPLNQIMLIHGFGLSTASFEGLADEYVKAGYRVVLVDVPNFGYSSREKITTKLADRESLIFDLMASLGGTWIVGGHSMGGGIAANLAIEHPETVTGLVLFAPQTSMSQSKPAGLLMRSAPVRIVYELLIRFASRSNSTIKSLVAMSFSDSEYAESYDISKISDPLKIKGTGAGVAIMASHARETDVNEFAKLKIPVVIVTASDDKIASQSNLDALINAAPAGLSTYNFEHGGHMMMEYDPQQAAAVTLKTIEAATINIAA